MSQGERSKAYKLAAANAAAKAARAAAAGPGGSAPDRAGGSAPNRTGGSAPDRDGGSAPNRAGTEAQATHGAPPIGAIDASAPGGVGVASIDPRAFTPERRGAFGGFIGPRNLAALVENAAPFLFDGTHRQTALVPAPSAARLCEQGAHPFAWWSILRQHERVEAAEAPTPAQRTDYFALCLAAHFASVATYVPTDVDTKIRNALWFEDDLREELEARRELALALAQWDISGVSARCVIVDELGSVSGHDGERLSVLCGGLLGSLAAGDERGAGLLDDAVAAELAREAAAFQRVLARRGDELTLIRLAMILTHNAGDVMQAFNAKSAKNVGDDARHRYGELARERFDRFGGAFGRAAAIYRELGASEGHRNYPLREVKHLRASADLLLPLAPFLDDWGGTLARWPGWTAAERAEVVGALVVGNKRVAGQEGYFRALCGFEAAYPGGIEAREIAAHFPTAVRRELKDSELRKKLAVRRESFESACAKRARAVLDRVGRGSA